MKEISSKIKLKSTKGTGKWKIWAKILEIVSMIFDYLGL